jgi:SAM-dependent methyltransferase
VDWAEGFYSTTGRWWGAAESGITQRDHDRVALVRACCGTEAVTMLELGCGYGNTAAAAARNGFRVTGVDISGTRLEFAKQYANADAPASPRFVHADFYTFETAEQFDVVCYWNGFGIGTDADQRRLLRLIRDRWLAPGGRAIIDVANPLVWARWAGDTSHRAARPDAGYQHALTELTDFDPAACRYTDTWWEQDQPEQRHTQTGRCYTPADFRLLLEGTGLTLAGACVAGAPIDLGAPHAGHAGLLAKSHEWTAVLIAVPVG